MLTLRPIDPDDYSVLEDGQPIGRIRLAKERSPPVWSWSVNVLLPGPPFGSADDPAQAKEAFRNAWETFKAKHDAAKLATAYDAMNHANRPDRYRRS